MVYVVATDVIDDVVAANVEMLFSPRLNNNSWKMNINAANLVISAFVTLVAVIIKFDDAVVKAAVVVTAATVNNKAATASVADTAAAIAVVTASAVVVVVVVVATRNTSVAGIVPFH